MPGCWGGQLDSTYGLTGLDVSTQQWSLTWWYWGRGHVCDIWGHRGSTYDREGVWIENRYSNFGSIIVFVADATTTAYAQSSNRFILRHQWAHYGMVMNGLQVLWHRNGVLVETSAMVGNVTPTTGGTRTTNSRGGNGYVAGKIFDIRHFPNVSLTQGEVRATMNPNRNIAGCMGRWWVNWRVQASGRLEDFSGNGNHLTQYYLPTDQSAFCEEPPWREAVGAR